MTEIEKQALALVNEEAGCEYETLNRAIYFTTDTQRKNALCRALEQKSALQAEFDQFRQDVSDAVEADVNKQIQCGVEPQFRTNSVRFILLKPVDPLVEVMNEMGFGWSQTASDEFRQALAKRGLKIVEAG